MTIPLVLFNRNNAGSSFGGASSPGAPTSVLGRSSVGLTDDELTAMLCLRDRGRSAPGLGPATSPNRSHRRKEDVAVGGGSWQGQWQLEAVGGSPVAVHGSPSKLSFPLFSGLKRENRGKLTKTLPLTATNCHLDVNVLGLGIGGCVGAKTENRG
jgi:hypothetical protein